MQWNGFIWNIQYATPRASNFFQNVYFTYHIATCTTVISRHTSRLNSFSCFVIIYTTKISDRSSYLQCRLPTFRYSGVMWSPAGRTVLISWSSRPMAFDAIRTDSDGGLRSCQYIFKGILVSFRFLFGSTIRKQYLYSNTAVVLQTVLTVSGEDVFKAQGRTSATRPVFCVTFAPIAGPENDFVVAFNMYKVGRNVFVYVCVCMYIYSVHIKKLQCVYIK